MNAASTAGATVSLREKTAALRRQHILEAAVRVFAERGYHRATIHDVAVAAGVSDGAIYTVFANKQALLLGMLNPLDEAGQAAVFPAADLESLIRGLLVRRWEAYTPHVLPMLRVVLSEVLIDHELRALFVDRVISPALSLPEPLFDTFAANGDLAAPDVRMTLRFIVGGFLGLLLLRLLGDDLLETRANEVPNALADLLLRGLRPRGAVLETADEGG